MEELLKHNARYNSVRIYVTGAYVHFYVYDAVIWRMGGTSVDIAQYGLPKGISSLMTDTNDIESVKMHETIRGMLCIVLKDQNKLD